MRQSKFIFVFLALVAAAMVAGCGGGKGQGFRLDAPPPLVITSTSLPTTFSADFIDYEIELGVVIGKTCRYVQAEQALDYVAGYTVFNDISARKLIIPQERMARDGDRWFDWLNGKWFDTFAPMVRRVFAKPKNSPYQAAME